LPLFAAGYAAGTKGGKKKDGSSNKLNIVVSKKNLLNQKLRIFAR